MLNDFGIDRVYLACGATDLRKSIDGLAVLVYWSRKGSNWTPFPLSFCFLQPAA
ncbi:hypothetical protein [Neomoorella thermoacetica]|uniref:hypothetical protein n=1 Tax=Neomoorella thermoacetica TaxID=1525 RepID=UPI001E29CC10|nr:hypothetical protein [Moorella thermoacetica]